MVMRWVVQFVSFILQVKEEAMNFFVANHFKDRALDTDFVDDELFNFSFQIHRIRPSFFQILLCLLNHFIKLFTVKNALP